MPRDLSARAIEAARQVAIFNGIVPVGSPVMMELWKGGPRLRSVLSGEARVIRKRLAMVRMAGVHSPVPLRRLFIQPDPRTCWRRAIP